MNAETLFLIASAIILEIMFIAGERDGRNMWEEFERKKRRKKSQKCEDCRHAIHWDDVVICDSDGRRHERNETCKEG